MKFSLATVIISFSLVLAFACDPVSTGDIAVNDISPSSISQGESKELTVNGMGFEPIIVRTIGCGGEAFDVNSNFRVTISRSNEIVAPNESRTLVNLVNVQWVDRSTMIAELTEETSSGLTTGWYDVHITSPVGDEITLENGLEITPSTTNTNNSDTNASDTDTNTNSLDTSTNDTGSDTKDTGSDTSDTGSDTKDTEPIDTDFDTALTAPVARFTVLPGGGTEPTTFQFNAAGSTDAEDTFDELTFQWDWDRDGVFEHTGSTYTLTYYAAGTFPMVLRVIDSDGMIDYYTGPVTVVKSTESIVVTIPDDVVDSSDNEISLREAINAANTHPGPNTILVPKPMTFTLQEDLPKLVDNHTAIVGTDGALIIGNNNHCFHTDSGSNGISFFWLEITNCEEAAIFLEGTNHNVSNCRVYSNSNAGMIVSAENVIVGPENHIYSNGEQGIRAIHNNITIIGNFIYQNAASGIRAESGTASLIVQQNLIQKNEYGAYVDSSVSDSQILNNTFYSNRLDGLQIEGNNQLVQNNIFSENSRNGISNLDNATTNIANNLFYKNDGYECYYCTTGIGPISADPKFAFTNDVEFRISGSSPCINAGRDNGDDLNGPATGNFNSTAPDIGNWESPW